MSRYLRILRLFWTASFAAEMEYRAHFLVALLTSLTSLGGSLFTLHILYRAGNGTLGGWAWHEALLVMGLFTLFEGVSSVLLSPNLSRIVMHVQMGTLDFVLLKPVDSQFWLSTRNFSPWGLPNMLLGLALVAYAGGQANLSAWLYLRGLLPLALGLIVLYSLWFVLGATSVWFVKIYNATEVLRTLLESGRYPSSAFPRWYRVVLTFIVPVAFITTVPAEAILGRATPSWLAGAAALALILFLFARWFWRFALRYYTSASS